MRAAARSQHPPASAVLVADAAEDVAARIFQCMALGRADQIQLDTVRNITLTITKQLCVFLCERFSTVELFHSAGLL